MEGRHMIISIGRECGSGGHEIGEKLAAMYGLKLYDKNLIGAIAAHTGKDADYLVKLEEKVKRKKWRLLSRTWIACGSAP